MEYDPNEHYPLADAIDHEILMHREVHFGGHFPTMIDYYQKEGKGVQAEFDLARIEELAKLEGALGQNLAVLYLAGSEAEKVAEVKNFYKQLRSIYEINNPKNRIPQLIADLILTEDEEANEEIQVIVAEKERIVPFLIDLLRNEELYDPLFPGYGQAPSLAVKCLGLIGDKRAIISLFESLGQGDFFADDQILKALKAIGEPAKTFLLRVVEGKPINEDNERAAIALIQFKDDEQVGHTCLRLLHDLDVQRDPCLPTDLVLGCEGLTDRAKRNEFIALSKEKNIPRQLQEDMKAIIHGWEE
jgi:hypothetical protein